MSPADTSMVAKLLRDYAHRDGAAERQSVPVQGLFPRPADTIDPRRVILDP